MPFIRNEDVLAYIEEHPACMSCDIRLHYYDGDDRITKDRVRHKVNISISNLNRQKRIKKVPTGKFGIYIFYKVE